METQHDILVQNKRAVQFRFTINRKFTFIRGDSATGKTTLFQMISDAGSTRGTGVTVSCDVPVVALYETGYQYELSNERGRIYIIDEDFPPLKTKGFASLALRSDNCFIIITRESLPAIPYSYKEIYKIKTSGKFHFLEKIYPDFDKLIEKDVMVTEDEDAGLDYYKYHFGDKVVTSHGNSNLSKYGSCDSLLIGDGCAIGAYIQDLVMTRSELWSMARTGAIRCTRSVSRRCRSIWEMTFPTRISWRRPGRHSAWCGTRRRSNKYFLPDFVLHLFYMPLLPAYGLPYIIWERADENVANQMPEEQRRIGKEWDHGSCFEHR